MERAEARLKDNVWDIEAWQILVKEYSTKKLEDARPFYERLVTQFPLSGRYWKLYIDQEMKARNYTKVEQLFQRCLMKVLHIELWKCYLNYVKVSHHRKSSIQYYYSLVYESVFLEFLFIPSFLLISLFHHKNSYFSTPQFLQTCVVIHTHLSNQKKRTHTQINIA